MAKGFIYILSNPAMEGLLKIGFSTKVSTERAKELSSTGVPEPFKVSYYCLVENAKSTEKEVHEKLSDFRYSENREFFSIELGFAIRAITSTCKPEHQWSDEIILRSTRGEALNLNDLDIIRGINILSRRQEDYQVEQMINFSESVYRSGLAHHVKSLTYCSNSDCCSFEFTREFTEYSSMAKDILLVARETIGQFDWFGSVYHGKPSHNQF